MRYCTWGALRNPRRGGPRRPGEDAPRATARLPVPEATPLRLLADGGSPWNLKLTPVPRGAVAGPPGAGWGGGRGARDARRGSAGVRERERKGDTQRVGVGARVRGRSKRLCRAAARQREARAGRKSPGTDEFEVLGNDPDGRSKLRRPYTDPKYPKCDDGTARRGSTAARQRRELAVLRGGLMWRMASVDFCGSDPRVGGTLWLGMDPIELHCV
jgi:hypothetical protein